MQWEYMVLAAMAMGIVLLLLLGIWTVRKSSNKRTEQFHALCRSTGLKMDLFEFFSNRLIGVDYNAAVVLFMHFDEDVYKHTIVPVDDLETCVIEKQQNENKITSAIYLNCLMKNRTTIRLNFYSTATDNHFDATQLIRKASYWRKKINLLKQLDELSLQQYQ